MHLSDAFIQSDLQCIQVIHVLLVCVFPGNRTHNLCAANTMLYHWATGTQFSLLKGKDHLCGGTNLSISKSVIKSGLFSSSRSPCRWIWLLSRCRRSRWPRRPAGTAPGPTSDRRPRRSLKRCWGRSACRRHESDENGYRATVPYTQPQDNSILTPRTRCPARWGWWGWWCWRRPRGFCSCGRCPPRSSGCSSCVCSWPRAARAGNTAAGSTDPTPGSRCSRCSAETRSRPKRSRFLMHIQNTSQRERKTHRLLSQFFSVYSKLLSWICPNYT